MAYNDRIQIDSQDISHPQLAPSQSARTQFTPGLASSRPLDMNWPKEFRIPTGTAAFQESTLGAAKKDFMRVEKLGRNIINDQTVTAIIPPTTVNAANVEKSVGGNMAEPNV